MKASFLERIVFNSKHRIEQCPSCRSFENLFSHLANGIGRQIIFVNVDQEISFHQNLIVYFYNGVIRMMMPYQPTYPFYLCFRKCSHVRQQFPGFIRTFQLLMLSIADSVFLLTNPDANVMHNAAASKIS